MSDTDTALVGAQTEASAPTGYRPPPRYRTVRGEPGTAFDGEASGSAPIEATIRCNLIGGELDWLKAATQNDEVKRRMAPYVVAWNCEAPVFDPETGEVAWEALPPPAEAGPDVLGKVEPWTVVWLRVQLCQAPLRIGDDHIKPLRPSAPPAAGTREGPPPLNPGSPSPIPSPTSPPAPTPS